MNRKIMFYILALIMFLFSIFVGGKFPFLLFFLIILTIIYSTFSNNYNKKNLQGVFWINKYKFTRGEIFKIEYKIYNSGLLPIPYIEIEENINERLIKQKDKAKIFFIKPFDYIKIKKEYKSLHRGKYDVGNLDIIIEDIFSIKKSKMTLKDSLDIIIYPKIYDIKNINLFGKDFFGSDKTNEKHNEDYSNIKNLREYAPGDSLRRIHWKTSARKGQFFVKNFNTSSKINVKVFMDFEENKFLRNNRSLEDVLIEITSSIIHFTLKNNIETEFISYTDKKLKMKLNNISLFNSFLDNMVTISPKMNRKLSDTILEEVNITSLGTTIVIATIEIDKSMIDTILNIRKMGINITIFIIRDSFSKIDDERILKLKSLNIIIYKLYNDDNLEKVLGDRYE